MNRIAARPRIRRLADRAERLHRQQQPLAVIARERHSGRVRVHFATHLGTDRTTPANSHRFVYEIVTRKMSAICVERIARSRPAAATGFHEAFTKSCPPPSPTCLSTSPSD